VSRGVLPRRERSIVKTLERLPLPVRFLRLPRGDVDVALALPHVCRAPFHLQALPNNPIPVPHARRDAAFAPLGQPRLIEAPAKRRIRGGEALGCRQPPHFGGGQLALGVLVTPPPDFEGDLRPKDESLHADYRCGWTRAK
jgi:hypothetical protein